MIEMRLNAGALVEGEFDETVMMEQLFRGH